MRRGFLLCSIAWLALTFIAACAPEPTATPAPTRRPTRTPIPPVTLKPRPTQPIPTATPLPTETPEPSPTATPLPSPQALAKAPAPNSGSLNVWTMAPMINYFQKLDPPRQDMIPRPPNVNPLTGLVVGNPAFLQRRPILARIGNDKITHDIHAGFNQADLVFEEMIDQIRMNFVLTRYTLVFYGQSGAFRPVRSARAINASLVPMFDGILVHSGASDPVRFLISNLPWKAQNVDGDFNNAALCFVGNDWRTRVVSSVERIHEYLAPKLPPQAVTLRGFQFSEVVPTGAPAQVIALDHGPWPFHGLDAKMIEWRYDPASGNYLRFLDGAPHNTHQYALEGQWGGQCIIGPSQTEQIRASNVVVLNARYDPTDFVEDTRGSYGAFVELVGEGTAQIFRNGVKIDARWERPSLTSFIRFVDAQGNEIPLKPGNTWFEIVPLGYTATVK